MPNGVSKLRKYAPLLVALAIGLVVVGYVLAELFSGSQTPSGRVSFTEIIKSWGYGGVFGLMTLEASSLPVPSEIVLPFAGYLVYMGHLEFFLTLAAATVGALVGSMVDYFIGLKGVQALTKYRLLGHAVFSESQLKVAANIFTRYGAVMVFVGRLIPVVRTLISIPAGAVKMPLAKFLSYTLAGCLIWNSLLIYVGYYLGSKWDEVASFSHYIALAVVAVAVAAAAWYFFVYRRNNKKKAQSSQIKTN